MLRRLLLPVGALLALCSATTSLPAQAHKPPDAKPAHVLARDTRPPLAATLRSDRANMLLGENAVITVAVKNSLKAPEVVMPLQSKGGGLQYLSGPELRPTILDAI